MRSSLSLASALATALQRCAAWHGLQRVKLTRSDPADFGKLLRAALKA